MGGARGDVLPRQSMVPARRVSRSRATGRRSGERRRRRPIGPSTREYDLTPLDGICTVHPAASESRRCLREYYPPKRKASRRWGPLLLRPTQPFLACVSARCIAPYIRSQESRSGGMGSLLAAGRRARRAWGRSDAHFWGPLRGRTRPAARVAGRRSVWAGSVYQLRRAAVARPAQRPTRRRDEMPRRVIDLEVAAVVRWWSELPGAGAWSLVRRSRPPPPNERGNRLATTRRGRPPQTLS